MDNHNLQATRKALGLCLPGVIQYGISKNPEMYWGRTMRPEKKLFSPMNTAARICAVGTVGTHATKAWPK